MNCGSSALAPPEVSRKGTGRAFKTRALWLRHTTLYLGGA
ncbi:hypothetical protein HMPREF1548_00892 [Clostridium sp. KLE 1755]|nr:hypothetical protein HMPREF1548_00892 [Clostridium sp. KLE 1755]